VAHFKEGGPTTVRRLMLICALACCAITVAESQSLEDPPPEGEAFVWYLGHAGWLVRTAQHCLIFDALGPFEEGDLDRGALSPELLAGQNVVLFISHAHDDHLDPRVLGLRDATNSSAVVLGWDPASVGDAVVPADSRWTDVSGAQVFTLHHEFDVMPEGFFLVRSGGVTIFHSGDHGTTKDPPDEEFRVNIDRMASEAGGVDIAFISSFGTRNGPATLNAGDVYTIRALEPRTTMPMHCGGCEERYTAFAREVSALNLPTTIEAADAPGWFFHYRGGTGE
jgi:L-ascorbate metabolism protein UlaG (beta-lactamase superfamily)